MIKKFINDEKAVSISVSTMLLFSITVITLIVVISSFYTMMDREGYMVTRNQFEIHGNDLALQISNIDTAVQVTKDQGGTVENISYSFSLPPTIADHQYSIEFANSSNEIIFESQGKTESVVRVTYVTTEVEVSSMKMYSGPDKFEFYYNSTSNMIEVHDT